MAEEKVAPEATVEQEANTQTQAKEEPLTLEAVKKMIQSETDRVRTEYSRKLKEVETEKEELQKERMTEKERSTYELEQARKRNEETAAQLARRELALERANVITEMQIPKELAPYVDGKDRDDIAHRAADFMKVFRDAVQQETNKRLANSGPAPQSGEPARSTQSGDKDAWEAAWKMKPGPEKDAALERLFESLKGQAFNNYTG